MVKQRISVEQVRGLSPEQKEKLVEHLKICLPDPMYYKIDDALIAMATNIGQMIEILSQNKEMQPGWWSTREHGDDECLCNVAFQWWAPSHVQANELCDALFEAVKSIL